MHNRFATRLYVMLIICLGILGLLIGRMAYMQLWRTDYYAKQSDGNRLRKTHIPAARGLILADNGMELVKNGVELVVYLQKQNEYDEEHLKKIAEIIQVPLKDIKERIKLSKDEADPVVLKRGPSVEVMAKLDEQRRLFPELIVQPTPCREYPYNDFAVHALGYVGEVSPYEIEQGIYKNAQAGSIVGKAGLESYYDQFLRGQEGTFLDEVDVTGAVVRHHNQVSPVPGKNLKTTINYDLQKTLEEFTDKHLAFLRNANIAPAARAAAVIAIDPRTGAIKAMVSRPSFNPNWFVNGISEENWKLINEDISYPLNNKTISGEYPPGSTFKIVTGSAAFEEDKVTMDELILDRGYHPMVPEMGNAAGEILGWLNFTRGLAMSDNVYFYELGYRVGIDALGKYARIYGFGSKTGVDLDGEAEGLVASKKVKMEIWDEDWRLGDTFNAAIGQGFNLVTPIQLARMLGIVAENGISHQPYLVDEVLNPDGTLFQKIKHPEPKHINISQETLDNIHTAMNATTQEGGTAAFFSGLPRAIAGKTGTAENSMGEDHGLFVAYGPVEDPELVVVCIVEQGSYGSTAAGPIVYRAFEEYFQQRGWMPRPQPANTVNAAQAVQSANTVQAQGGTNGH